MDYQSNPFFQSPYIAQAGNNLIKAFNDDGRSAENAARTKLIGAQTEETQQKSAGRESAAGAFQGFDPSQPITAQFLQNAYAGMVRSGVDPAHASAAILGMTANGGAPDSVVARSFVGDGKAIGKDTGFSIADREGVAKRENDAAFSRTKYSSDSSAGATIGAANIHEAGANNRAEMADNRAIAYQFMPDPNNPGGAPVPVAVTKKQLLASGGANPVLPNNYYEKGTNAEGKPVYGLPGGGGVTPVLPPDRLITAFDPNSPTGRALQEPRVGVPIPAPEKPPHIVNEKANGQIEMDALGSLGVWDAANGGANPTFAKEYAKQMEAARIASADTLQKTGNAGLAQKAYIDALGIQPGSDVSVPGMIGRLRGKGVEVTPPSGAAAAPAGTAQAAPTISSNFAPPPAAGPAQSAAPPPPPADPAQRKPGVYTTPKGPMTWTGSGWLPPTAANDGAR